MISGRRVAVPLLLTLKLSEAGLGLSWPSLSNAERGADRLKNTGQCDGHVKCSKFVSDSPDFLVDANATSLGCAFGHVADDGSCDVPCTGMGSEVCRCLSREEARGDNDAIAGLSFALGLIFTLVGCCACCCVGAEMLGRGAVAPVAQAHDLEPGQLLPSRDGLLQRGPREFVKKGRTVCALLLGLFFAVWLFFSSFLVAFGLWVLVIKRNAYYNGCF